MTDQAVMDERNHAVHNQDIHQLNLEKALTILGLTHDQTRDFTEDWDVVLIRLQANIEAVHFLRHLYVYARSLDAAGYDSVKSIRDMNLDLAQKVLTACGENVSELEDWTKDTIEIEVTDPYEWVIDRFYDYYTMGGIYEEPEDYETFLHKVPLEELATHVKSMGYASDLVFVHLETEQIYEDWLEKYGNDEVPVETLKEVPHE